VAVKLKRLKWFTEGKLPPRRYAASVPDGTRCMETPVGSQ